MPSDQQPTAPAPISEKKGSADAYRSAAPAWKAGDEVYEIHVDGRLTPGTVLKMHGEWAVLEGCGDAFRGESHVAPYNLLPRRAVDDWERVRDALRNLHYEADEDVCDRIATDEDSVSAGLILAVFHAGGVIGEVYGEEEES